ncbi:LysE family transporter [Aurantivibrio plasticivorans]
MLVFMFAAISFGVAAGIKPGPLGVFIIHQTLTRGVRVGFLASLAPFITDGPIIIIALLLSTTLHSLSQLEALLSLLGGLYLLWIGYKLLMAPSEINPQQSTGASSLLTAVKINALNPSPYLFWLTIGSSYIAMGTALEAGVFIIVALTSLCLTKLSVALAVFRLGNMFNKRLYALFIKIMALPLFIFAVHLLYRACQIWLP